MKTRLTLAALALAGLSFGANAATFEAAKPYQLLLVDGEKTKHSAFNTVHSTEVKGGKHQFVLEYVEDYSTKQHIRVMEGDPVIINLDTPADANLSVEYKKPINYQQARAFLRDQASQISIVDKRTGQAVAAEVYTIHRPAGLNLASGIQDYLKVENKDFNGRTDAAVAAATAKFGDAAVDADSLDMLKYWWNSADKDTQRAFQIWMIQQQ
ncbi:DUF2057 domain-containing protein [Oceanisphaera pacifica]|uniref:DUF2057 domain-containing protein n=1 Tax=Oceanisphaera pacifica TaxID=2818389 RepID=A0ABS3NDU6_9GAMM|nr:DUF2057 domain-containing protein [Oceanisphaera pacifica]MBO1518695.1 DUF2057 domain-containing protein [Oceanisphaera pacifica]